MPIGPEEAAWNAATIADFRAHDGQITTGPLAGSKLLLLTVVGARSGLAFTSPLGYTLDADRYVVVGSNSGGPANPDWVHNVRIGPLVTVEVADMTFRSKATVEEGEERRRLLDAHIASIPIFATYETMTARPLPVVTFARIDP